MLAKPVIMGGLMGLMMLGMAHLMLTGGSKIGGAALLMFAGVHIALALAVFFAGLFAARLSPPLKARIDRFHRPRATHIVMMLISAACVMALVHLIVHGGI